MRIFDTSLRFDCVSGPFEVPDVIDTSLDAARAFETVFDMSNLAQEIFCALYMDADSRVLGIERVQMGDVHSGYTSFSEVFKRALVLRATKISVAHNHPNGSPRPSFDDIVATFDLAEVGEPLGIELVNALVIGNGVFSSMMEFVRTEHKIGADEAKITSDFSKYDFPAMLL